MLGEVLLKLRSALLWECLHELLGRLLVGRPEPQDPGGAGKADMTLNDQSLANDVHDIGEGDRDFGLGREPKGPRPAAAEHDAVLFKADLTLTGNLPVPLWLSAEPAPPRRIGKIDHERSRCRVPCRSLLERSVLGIHVRPLLCSISTP